MSPASSRGKARRALRALVVVVLVALGVSLIALVALFLGLEGGVIGGRFMLKSDEIIVENQPHPAYEQLFPYYVELCALSQWRPKSGGTGGVAGHAVMYIKGACKDEDAPFPQLRRCGVVATELDDPLHGAGLSVNRWFRNVNWVATPGYELFYDGNLAPGEGLTRAHRDATVRDAIDRGIFDGVELHEYPTEAAQRSLEDFVARESIATDFALRFGRTASCARLPVTSPMLDEIIAFLNDKNREYATGEADYNWSGTADNCIHTLRNALAAANVWSPLSVRAVKLRRFFNLAVPANQMMSLAILGAEGPVADYSEIVERDQSRDALHDFGWLPTRHGALVKTLPVHTPNDMYDTSFRLFVAQTPLRRKKTKEAVRLLSDERFVDLRANLLYFREKYERILTSGDERVDGMALLRGDPYRRGRRLHRTYIEAQLAEVEAMLERLDALEASSDGADGKR